MAFFMDPGAMFLGCLVSVGAEVSRYSDRDCSKVRIYKVR